MGSLSWPSGQGQRGICAQGRCYAERMILGREPIQFLGRGSAIVVLLTPFLCFGQGQPSVQGDTWTSPPEAKAPEAVTPSSRPGAGPQSDRNAEPAATQDDVNEDFAEDTAMHWPEDAQSDHAGWDDYAADGTPADAPRDDSAPPHGRVRAPEYSLWLGAGLGWTLPFGNLWGSCAQADAYGDCVVVNGVPTHDYVKQGPAAELDIGARLARHYNLYGLWEHSWLGAGSATSDVRGQPDHGETDFLALGLRVSTDPNDLGFVLDIAVGTRRMRAVWSDRTELQLTDAPFETRLGLGADVRLDEHWSLTPMIALGLGSFGKVQWIHPDHSVQRATQPEDVALTHGWVGLQMAAHADLLGTR